MLRNPTQSIPEAVQILYHLEFIVILEQLLIQVSGANI